MPDTQDRIINECFTNGRVGVDCDDCEAHPRNAEDPDEACCFGVGHEYDHESCDACPYRTDCAHFSHGTPRNKKRSRRVIRRASSRSVRRRDAHHDEEPEELIQLPSRRSSANRIPEEEAPEEVFVQRLAKVTGWGMIEGGLQMALSFFQKNRPE